MAHEISGTRFIARGKPAWHQIGTVFSEDRQVGVEEALREADCVQELKKVKFPSITAFGQEIDTDLYGVVRQPTKDDPHARYLGPVSKDYEIVDNLSIARTLEPLAKEWPLETLGLLRLGDSFFVTLKIGTTVLNGWSEVERYFLVNGNHANGRATTIVETTVHVVCSNTLEMALNGRSVINLQHSVGANADLAVATSIIARLHHLDQNVVKQLEKLALARITEDQVSAIIEAAYPFPEEPAKASLARQAKDAGMTDEAEAFKRASDQYRSILASTDARRFQAMQAYDRINDEADQIAGTAWAALNAVTQVENYRPGRSDSSVSESILTGSRRNTMVRALAQASKVADSVLR